MKKQIFTLVLVSSVLSAAMLGIGTTVLGKYSPVLASSLGALVSGTDVHGTNIILSAEKAVLPEEPERDSLPKVVVTPLLHPALWAESSVSTEESAPGEASMTVADLSADPGQYMHQLFTISGMASLLSDNKILINDGTGEILITALNGLWDSFTLEEQMITVTGWLKSYSSISGIGASVCSISGPEGTLFIDVCAEIRLAAEPPTTATQNRSQNSQPDSPREPTRTPPPPTDQPTDQPTDRPPTDQPTDLPTDRPTDLPPTDEPRPTDRPTDQPTDQPTEPPPTDEPTDEPSPTNEPRPTESPDDHDNGIGNDDKDDDDDDDGDDDGDDGVEDDGADDGEQSFLLAPDDTLTMDQLIQDTISFTIDLSSQITDELEGFFGVSDTASGLEG